MGFLKVLYWDLYYFLFTFMWKKTTRHFGIQRMNKTWSYSHFNKATFIALPVSSIPPNFHRYGVLYSGTILKKLFPIIFDFSLFCWCWCWWWCWCSTTLILICDLYYVCLSFMILNVKWNLLISVQRWGSTPGEMRNTWWCSPLFLIYIYVKKTNTPFWNSADEHICLKLLTFKQSHIYTHLRCSVCTGTFKKKCFSNISFYIYVKKT